MQFFQQPFYGKIAMCQILIRWHLSLAFRRETNGQGNKPQNNVGSTVIEVQIKHTGGSANKVTLQHEGLRRRSRKYRWHEAFKEESPDGQEGVVFPAEETQYAMTQTVKGICMERRANRLGQPNPDSTEGWLGRSLERELELHREDYFMTFRIC